MGIPNTTPATAIDFGTLPNTITQTYGTDLTGWYSYTGHAGEVIAGFWARAAIPGDSLTVTVFESDGTTQFLGMSALNVPMQVPQSEATLLYFRVVASAPPSTDVVFSALPGPTALVPVGAIFVNDETTGFATGCVSPTDGANYQVLRFFNMAITASENGGDVLANGRFLVASDDDSTYRLYDGQLTLLVTVSGLVNPVFTSVKTCVGAQVFYVCKRIAHTITRVDGNGLVTQTWNTGLACIAASASNDELVIYVTQGTTIKQWNPNTNSFDADLVAGIATYLTTDLLVIGDGKILAQYTKSGSPILIKCYDAAGTTLHTYTLGNSTSSEASLFHALDDPTTFWTRVHDVVAAKTCTFYNIRISDGAILSTVTQASYNNGTYLDTATMTPSARFGLSTSCPAFILRESITSIATIDVIKVTVPSGSTQSFGFTTTKLTPASFSLHDGEIQSFDNLAPDSGYGVTETPVTGWETTYEVSNGNPHDAITLSSGDAVIVTVTNTKQSQPVCPPARRLSPVDTGCIMPIGDF